MKIEHIVIIALAGFIGYAYFVYQGAREKYYLDIVEQVFPSKDSAIKQSFDLFKIGIGITKTKG